MFLTIDRPTVSMPRRIGITIAAPPEMRGADKQTVERFTAHYWSYTFPLYFSVTLR